MQTIQVNHAGVSRLRCIFDGKVVSLSFAASAPFGEVARMLGELSDPRYGNPVAVDVTLALPPALRNGWRVACTSEVAQRQASTPGANGNWEAERNA